MSLSKFVGELQFTCALKQYCYLQCYNKASVSLLGSETRRLLSSKASACESGWDFSSRWMSDYRTMATLATSQIVPVDLNTYLCVMEQVLAKLHQQLG